MRRHEEAADLCPVCGNEGVAEGSPCVVPKLPSAADRMAEMAARRRSIEAARAITESDGEEAKAIRAHLITMGWRPPT